MENILSIVHEALFMGVATLFFFQSAVLFIRSKNNKARRTMAFLDLIWGLVYGLTLVGLLTNHTPHDFPLLRDKVLILGGVCIMFTNFFPIQVLLPGWLNWKRAFLLVLPILFMSAVYYGGMFLCQEEPVQLTSIAMIWDCIGYFNVWFRLVMLLINMAYLGLILAWLYKFEKKYIQWKNENFSDQEYQDISWMRFYDYIVVGITIFYLGILFFEGRTAVICHGLFVITSFSYLFYKILFYESPYPKDFFASEDSIAPSEGHCEEYELPTAPVQQLNDQNFEHKMTCYMEELRRWLEEDKPYLYNDFKLTDVTRFLPLNRSYLSRIFNEGFGQNFSEVVRNYRIGYSKELLRKNPDMPMYKVAELSGFRSDSTFVRAFKQVTQMTPGQFKAEEGDGRRP